MLETGALEGLNSACVDCPLYSMYLTKLSRTHNATSIKWPTLKNSSAQGLGEVYGLVKTYTVTQQYNGMLMNSQKLKQA